MKKKLLAILLAAMMLFTVACDDEDYDYDDDYEETTSAEGPHVSGTAVSGEVSGISLQVNGESGDMQITRADVKSDPMGDSGTWTVFVYLCGTDLESDELSGAATDDVSQMMSASSNENVRFVFQTGGTYEWANDTFDANACERYVVEDGSATLVDSVEISDMGDPNTLVDFLNWGIANYPAEKMGVVFWDHGSGSINGACFDELNDSDSLSLAEMNTAFASVYENMTDQFEFIGFDCCLMGTVETANLLATYARYFYGSQETEPGSGWDYTAIGDFLAKNPDADGAALGKEVADSFYAECDKQGMGNECTFTIVDLSKFDTFVIAFNEYAKALFESSNSDLAGIVRGATSADNFGGNNRSDGYTNMVDLGGIVDCCSSYADGSTVKAALANCIVYNINGSDHTNASGLSIYYPLQVEGSNELGIFSGVCISPYYLSLVDMIAKGYTDTDYSNEEFFNEDGDWETADCENESYDDDSYFDYADEEGDGESSLITFASQPHLDTEGSYGFTLAPDALDYATEVCAFIFFDGGEDELLELGDTDDIVGDWETGEFKDNFDGYWLSLPDDQLLATYIVDITDEYTIFSAPVLLNGKETNLRIRVYQDYTVELEGAWDGIDENGAAAREIIPVKAGDKVTPLYYMTDDSQAEGDAYTWASGDDIYYGSLPAGDYYYGFDITDCYGDFVITDVVIFSIDEDGNITFEEE